ncbi:16S rRNA (guanine527-N7)-methyltransferase [Anaerobranca californiensis DSM 14826]|jgi:16S rRNA (guanine527-N7)-methyltransferase|uniref:Ribosomal RNA small subunit methyltransferase G n=1 Tax=Anaerobranca californiensis DSM 14826 TaxID=1120989 RepID=A0A1M6M2P5_9FIRM|nr:16S rRNA (guanine(527)-N(7))-methyltransferase RsmG [Anaerobranca californiensis]SHJ77603.1 16S rRNA (guanine527-N7)-methyltransferase [Anaerobranca californiensis DSM 14826]
MEILKGYLNGFNIQISDHHVEKFLKYKELLLDWNEKINLTAIVDDDGIAIKHFVDSIIPINEFTSGCSIIDVGSGAGFPGVPLAIVNGNLKVTALDSLQKRLKFLQEVKNNLNLDNLTLIHGRAEDYGKDVRYRETFCYATARAVAPLNILAELCLPFVKVGGYFIAYKGDKWEEEIQQSLKAIELLGGKIEKTYTYTLPKISDVRSIIKIKKVFNTDQKYPRKAGIPHKKPL